jgi:hypothetical protein
LKNIIFSAWNESNDDSSSLEASPIRGFNSKARRAPTPARRVFYAGRLESVTREFFDFSRETGQAT